MIYIGPISSIYDFLTFFALLKVFHASEQLFHTGWFVESLATQTLVIFIIRTAGNPLRSRPSVALATTTVLVVLVGIMIPYTALGALLGFTALPGTFLLFLAAASVTYLLLVEVVKRRLMRSCLDELANGLLTMAHSPKVFFASTWPDFSSMYILESEEP